MRGIAFVAGDDRHPMSSEMAIIRNVGRIAIARLLRRDAGEAVKSAAHTYPWSRAATRHDERASTDALLQQCSRSMKQ
jgi:hypothetical protein